MDFLSLSSPLLSFASVQVLEYPDFVVAMTMVTEDDLGLKLWRETDLLKGVDLMGLKRGLSMGSSEKLVQLLGYQADRVVATAGTIFE